MVTHCLVVSALPIIIIIFQLYLKANFLFPNFILFVLIKVFVFGDFFFVFQIYAVENIIKHIVQLETKRKEALVIQFVNNLIKADFMEIICQVMATLDVKLLG